MSDPGLMNLLDRFATEVAIIRQRLDSLEQRVLAIEESQAEMPKWVIDDGNGGTLYPE